MKRKVYGIDVGKLIKEKDEEEEEKKVDWESLSPFPYAFNGDLPVNNPHHIELDSKIHLVGGLEPLFDDDIECDSWVPSLKIYELEHEFDVSGDKKKPRFEVCESVPKAPLPYGMLMSQVAKISGDYYFLVFEGILPMSIDCSFWVLRSRLRVGMLALSSSFLKRKS